MALLQFATAEARRVVSSCKESAPINYKMSIIMMKKGGTAAIEDLSNALT
jgi:hypothetical protein